MSLVAEHYDKHLGPIYAWMIGDVGAAMDCSRAELRSLGLRPESTGVAVDLGAALGLHAIPLAELGFSVLAMDTCATLVEELRRRAGSLPIRVVDGDLLGFREWLTGPADVIVCMGDTLTHLPSREAVEQLMREVVSALSIRGSFLVTFRDYATTVLEGTGRFIPVRSDDARSLTCFLEYGEEIVTVYDILHERRDGRWQLQVSSYPKLRLDPAWVADTLRGLGLTVQQDLAPNGMARICGRRLAHG